MTARPVQQTYSDPLSVELFGLNPTLTVAVLKPYFHEAHVMILQANIAQNKVKKQPNPYLQSPKKMHIAMEVVDESTSNEK